MTISWIKDELESIKEKGLLRALREIGSPQSAEIELDDKKVINFCSNDYLGLASEPLLKRAAHSAAMKWGTGSGSSRLIAGNLSIFTELEEKIARFKGTESALLYPSGYHANLGVIPSLVGQGDAVFSDVLNHASIIDGCRLSNARKVIFEHCDPDDLDNKLSLNKRARRKLVIVESLFSMEGDMAPLPEIIEISRKHGAMIMVDDAHATGVMGATGRGSLEHFGLLGEDADVVMGTLGKALGSSGAFICGKRKLMDYLVNRSRTFIFTTGPSPISAGVAIEALRLIDEQPWRKERTLSHSERVRSALSVKGDYTGQSIAVIVPVVIGDAKITMQICEKMLERGIYVQGIRPPTVPEGTSRLRLSFSASHTDEHINTLIEALDEVLP